MIKKSNAIIQKKVLELKGGINELILALGFIDMEEEHYVFVGDYFTVLKRGQNMIENRL